MLGRTRNALLVTVLALMALGLVDRPPSIDPFAFFRPTVNISAKELQQLDAGDVVVLVLPSEAGEVAIFVAVRTTADGQRLSMWIRPRFSTYRGWRSIPMISTPFGAVGRDRAT